MKTPYLNDEWTLVDRLGYSSFVAQLMTLIDRAKPPFALGIYGGWGSGKTSIMRRLFFQMGGQVSSILLPHSDRPEKEALDPDTRKEKRKFKDEIKSRQGGDVPVWFNPWQHQLEDEPIVGLLHEIRENFNLFTKAGKEAQKLAHVTIRSGLDILSSLIKEIARVEIDIGKIEKHGAQYEAEHFNVKSSSQRFRLLFEKAVEKLTGGKKRRLVVFIDDLDRCVDDNIIKLIEGIKLYLSSNNCIFVFGLDQASVIRALDKRKIHRDYVDKLFQAVMRIPLSKNYTPFIKSIVQEYFSDIDFGSLANLLSDILEKNPRRVKNFLNSFRAHWESHTPGVKQALNIEVSALFHYLRTYYEPVFAVLERNPDFLPQLVDICRNEPPNLKAGHFFYENLKNPIAEKVSSALTESEKLVPSKIEAEELQLMGELSLRYDCLEKFKQHFAEAYSRHLAEKDNLTILRYLGVIFP